MVESKAKAIESTLKGYNIFCWFAIIIYFLYIGKGKGKGKGKSKGKVAAKGCILYNLSIHIHDGIGI